MKKKILLIDDDLLIGQTVVMGLQDAGYDTHYQSSLAALNTVIDEFKPDVIVLDVEIGTQNGIDCANSIKSLVPHTPLLYISSHIDGLTITRAIEEGAVAYIKKPFDITELIAYIKMCLSKNHNNQNASTTFGKSELIHIDRTLHIANDPIPIQLTKQEYLVLKLLVDNIGCVTLREDIETSMGGNSISEQSINNIIHRLRKYIEPDSSIKIDTVRGIGHKIIDLRQV